MRFLQLGQNEPLSDSRRASRIPLLPITFVASPLNWFCVHQQTLTQRSQIDGWTGRE